MVIYVSGKNIMRSDCGANRFRPLVLSTSILNAFFSILYSPSPLRWMPSASVQSPARPSRYGCRKTVATDLSQIAGQGSSDRLRLDGAGYCGQ